jgi:pyruvate dehydrogenase E2 component (dihydrolipoamide acetyltransferase)
MKTYEFKLPDIGEGVTEGEIVKWLCAPGDSVQEDQPIVEVMTDKATVTITSPRTGTVLETRGEVGGIVPVHSVLVVFDLGSGAGVEASPAAASVGKAEPAATAVGDIRESLPGMEYFQAPEARVNHGSNGHAAQALREAALGTTQSYFNEKPLATPATRALARDLGIDLRGVRPTGPGGRVTKDDVRAMGLGGATTAPATEAPMAVRAPKLAITTPAPSDAPPKSPPVTPSPRSSEPQPPATARQAGRGASVTTVSGLEERIPLRGVRKRIFEGMARSKHTAAHFTFVEECDVSALKELRARLRPAAEKEGVKLTFLPFFVKAVVAALKRHPTLNAAFDEATQEIVVRHYYDIGIASSTEAGLIVPVVRGADRKSILEIAREIQRLGDETKTGKVRPEDLGGSTFTITSLGQQGGLFATPILNFPEVGILGVHQMKQKPVVRDGQIVVGDVMLLSLSFDHRIIDGHVGAAFAYTIIGYLEDPDRLFLEMA